MRNWDFIPLHCNIDADNYLPTFIIDCMRIVMFSIAYVLGLYNNIYFHNCHCDAAFILNIHSSHQQVIRALFYPVKKVNDDVNFGGYSILDYTLNRPGKINYILEQKFFKQRSLNILTHWGRGHLNCLNAHSRGLNNLNHRLYCVSLKIYNKFANYFCELKFSGNTHQRP